MNTHKHARLTFARRLEMVKQMTKNGLGTAEAAARHGVTPPTVRKWLGRYMADGEAALAVHSRGQRARRGQSIRRRLCSLLSCASGACCSR